MRYWGWGGMVECMTGSPKENHPLRSLVCFINNVKTQLQSRQVTALEVRAWLRGSVAGSWGSWVTHHSSLPHAWPCRWPLWQMHFVASSHTHSQVRHHHDLPPSPCCPGHCNQTRELYPLFLSNLPPQLPPADVAKAHRIPGKPFSPSTVPLFLAMNPLWTAIKGSKQHFMKKYVSPWMAY